MCAPQYEFNCGTMELKGKTVTADKRKGKAVLSMEEDGLLRFQWRLRHSDNNEQQYYIFPQGATWRKVDECKDGRVFLLSFKDSSQRCFFWMQEPTSTAAKKDAEVLRKVNALINNPPKFGAPVPKDEEEGKDEENVPMADAVATVTRPRGDDVVVEGTNGAGPNIVAEAHRGAVLSPIAVAPRSLPAAGGAAAAPGASASSAAPAAASAGAGAGAGAAGAGGQMSANQLLSTLTAMAQQLQARQEEQAAGAGVEDVLDPQRVQPILVSLLLFAEHACDPFAQLPVSSELGCVSDSQLVWLSVFSFLRIVQDVDNALVDALVQYLPEGQRSPDALRAQLRSPQLQQTMSRLTEILNSAQFGQLMASLSLPATGGLGVDAFLKAIQEQAAKQQQQQQGGGGGSGSSGSSSGGNAGADKPKDK
jgi:hypothetical protein